MRWREISKIIKKAWEEKIKTDDGSYYKNHIADITNKKKILLKATRTFDTPLYILDEKKLKKDAIFFINTFRKYVANSEFFYAFKSNDLPYLIKTLQKEGYNADVGSLFELQLALKLKFKKIIFTSPGKTINEIKAAIKNKSKVIINIDNQDELEKIIKLTKNKRIKASIRINTDKKIMRKWSKFGVDLKDLGGTIKKAKKNNIKIIGLHFHSSWNETAERYCRNIKLIGSYLKNNFSKEDISKIEFLDIGGGFYQKDTALLLKFSHKFSLIEMIRDFSNKDANFDPYRFYIDEVDPLEKFAKDISKYLKRYIFTLKKDIKIFFEPGRYINTNSTHILVKVIARKKNSIIVDGGINLIGGSDFSEYLFAPIINLSNPSFRLRREIVYGPLCTPNDLWGYSYYGRKAKRGDILAILNQGSYNFSRAWRFLKETAPYVVIKNKRLILAKEKEKFEDRYARCKL